MSNSFFNFKQFKVEHDLCAMKVGTDGVTIGAWASADNPGSILDIGTGSGLIALMLAQRFNAQITAIDIDKNAFRQAEINFSNSPWGNRLKAYHYSLEEFSQTNTTKFDLITSNPPYFIDSLKNPDKNKQTARHAEDAFHEDIIRFSAKFLTPEGRLCIILPVSEGENLIELAPAHQLFCIRKTTIIPKPNAPAKRLLLAFSKNNSTCQNSELTIETNIRHEYSSEFTGMVKDFYLKL